MDSVHTDVYGEDMKHNKNRGSGSAIFGLILMLPFVALGVGRVWKSVQFDRHCEGRLKRAADANTIPIARKELDDAIRYLEETRRTEGYTSIIYQTPDEDVGFWYGNLKASSDELRRAEARKDMPQLESSNLLMKLRETLLDHGKEGTTVTVPMGISIYPANRPWVVMWCATGSLAFFGAVWIGVWIYG